MDNGLASVGGFNVAASRGNRALITCPHCNAPARIESSERVTETVKHLWMQCLNIDCSFAWKAAIEAVHELSPSAQPNPDVSIRPRPDGYPLKRFPATAGQSGHDPPDPRQIPMFGA